MKVIRLMFVSVVVMAGVEVQAQPTNFDLEYSQHSLDAVAQERPIPTESSTYWDRFAVSFTPCANDVFIDRFHPFNTMDMIGKDSGWAAHTAAGAFSKSILYSMREAAVGMPAMVWLDEHQSFLGRLLGDSVDNVGEESVAPLDPSYRASERHWWNEMSQDSDLHYGLRPFGTSPYAFLTTGFRENGRMFLQAHIRYHLENFSENRFECALSAPLPRGFSLDMGTSYQFGRGDEQKKLVVKLFKQFKGGGIIHLGLELQEHPTLFAGIAFAM